MCNAACIIVRVRLICEASDLRADRGNNKQLSQALYPYDENGILK